MNIYTLVCTYTLYVCSYPNRSMQCNYVFMYNYIYVYYMGIIFIHDITINHGISKCDFLGKLCCLMVVIYNAASVVRLIQKCVL